MKVLTLYIICFSNHYINFPIIVLINLCYIYKLSIYIIGRPLSNPIEIQVPSQTDLKLGLKAFRNSRVYVDSSSDEFIMHQPGLTLEDNSVSFESKRFPNFYLQVIEKELFLKPNIEDHDFSKYKII